MNIIAIIQARMGSQRLPGKVMLPLCSKPVLWHVIQRVSQVKLLSGIIVATSVQKENDAVCGFLDQINVPFFRGSENDVLARYYHAAEQFKADAVVRITADCPLIDPCVIGRVIRAFLHSSCEYASNTGERTYPRGLDCEIFTFRLLKRAFNEAKLPFEREHVTPFMYTKQDSVFYLKNSADLSNMRWTLDTAEDFEFIKEIYAHFYKGRHDFYMDDIYTFVKENPRIAAVNSGIRQKGLDES